MLNRNHSPELPETKRKLLNAGVTLMRSRGFSATSVDEICSSAGVTKGGFFYYFKSKEELAMAALQLFSEGKAVEYASAAFHQMNDPLDRVYGRLDHVIESIGGTTRLTKGCLIGMLAQELSSTNPEMRNLCQEAFSRIALNFAKDLEAAKVLYAPDEDFDPQKLAMFYLSFFQGASLIAKASESNAVLIDNIEQFRRYLQILFGDIKHNTQEKPVEQAIK
jgi:TetR/AcrR family transcriptional regulator, transcriptional repressor for nem operon